MILKSITFLTAKQWKGARAGKMLLSLSGTSGVWLPNSVPKAGCLPSTGNNPTLRRLW